MPAPLNLRFEGNSSAFAEKSSDAVHYNLILADHLLCFHPDKRMMLRPKQMTNAAPMILWMQSLSDPTRARLLRLLERTELTVVEMCTTLQLPQSTVSRHLKVLADDGWAGSRRDGTSNLYRMHISDMELPQKKLWSVVKGHSVASSTADQDDARLEQVIDARRSRSQAFFSSASEKWDRLRADLFGHRVDAWASAAAFPCDAVVGDLGCGTGAVAQILAPWVSHVIAVDSSAAMMQSARKRLKDHSNIELRRGELTQLPIEEKVPETKFQANTTTSLMTETPPNANGRSAKVTRRERETPTLPKRHERRSLPQLTGQLSVFLLLICLPFKKRLFTATIKEYDRAYLLRFVLLAQKADSYAS